MANTIGVTQSANFIPEVWANSALTKLEAEIQVARNIARDSEYTSARVGDKINIAKTGALTANQKVSGSAVTLQNPSDSAVTVTLDQHWEVSFVVEDIAKAQANQSIMDAYIADAITALAEKVEATCIAKYGSLTAGTVNSGGGTFAKEDFQTARGNLSSNRAPMSNRFAYLDPDAVNDVLNIAEFTSAEKYGSSTPVQEGELGKVYGFKVFESLFIPSAGSPSVQKNLYMHKDALILAMRPLPTPQADGVKVAVVDRNGLMLRVLYSYNADQLGDQVTIDALWGVNVLRPELGGVIEK